jgi:hypothetical protein
MILVIGSWFSGSGSPRKTASNFRTARRPSRSWSMLTVVIGGVIAAATGLSSQVASYRSCK